MIENLRFLPNARDARLAIRRARVVLVQARFGLSEKWVRISKEDARSLLVGIGPNETMEGSASFGTLEGDTLFLG